MMHGKGSTRIAVLLIASFVVVGVQAATFEVGQRWVYQHTGPRPGSAEPNAIDGQRILLVIAGPEPGRPHWVLQERYSEDEAVVGRLHVSEEGLTGFEIENAKGEVAQMIYDVPMAYPVPPLDVDKETIVENVLRVASAEFAMPVKVVTRRLADETLTTPAGRFADCRHYQTTTGSTINVKVAKVSLSEQRDQWYHESVNGLVKEVYRKDPVKFLAWSQEGYTATSVLVAFDTQEIEPAVAPAAPVEANDPPAGLPQDRRPIAAPSAAPVSGFPLWMPAAVVAVFAAAILILIKRPRHKQSTDFKGEK